MAQLHGKRLLAYALFFVAIKTSAYMLIPVPHFNIYLLLRDDFRIGLVISPRVAVLAWGEAEIIT